jgi:predicted AAA+ superfamily ATPase
LDIKNILKLKLYNRLIIDQIENWINDKEAILLLGARQTGKTSILYKIIQNLINSEKVNTEDIYFFDAENINHLLILSRGIDEICKIVKPDENKKKYIFLDEIQYVKNIDKTLKLLVDHYGNYFKIFATGSSSLEIKNKFKQSMTGRKIIFEVYPLSFYEYLTFLEEKQLADIIKNRNFSDDRSDIAYENMRQLKAKYLDYLLYGGYPRIVLESDENKKKILLDEIYSTYIKKDVEAFFKIEDIEKFNNFVKYAAINSGQIFNANSASKSLGMARKTIIRYLNILNMSYIIGVIRPFYKNKNKEILKMPKIYFYDNGIRNSILNNFNNIDSRVDSGVVLETSAYLNLLKYFNKRENIKFWRTKTGSEIDFIIDGEKFYAIECKKSLANFSINKYKDFLENYMPQKFFVFNLDKEENSKSLIYKLQFVI